MERSTFMNKATNNIRTRVQRLEGAAEVLGDNIDNHNEMLRERMDDADTRLCCINEDLTDKITQLSNKIDLTAADIRGLKVSETKLAMNTERQIMESDGRHQLSRDDVESLRREFTRSRELQTANEITLWNRVFHYR